MHMEDGEYSKDELIAHRRGQILAARFVLRVLSENLAEIEARIAKQAPVHPMHRQALLGLHRGAILGHATGRHVLAKVKKYIKRDIARGYYTVDDVPISWLEEPEQEDNW